MTDTVTVRALTEDDFSLLFKWLNEAHLRPHYRKGPISLQAVTEKYRPRLAPDHPVNCLIAEADNRPFGYLQWYANGDVSDHGSRVIAETEAVSLDYFIGEPACLGRRLGARMLKAALSQIAQDTPGNRVPFCVAHHCDNSAAIRCSLLAGFAVRKALVIDGEKHVLFVHEGTGGPLRAHAPLTSPT